MKSGLVFATLVISIAPFSAAQRQNDPVAAQIVDQFYPQAFINFMNSADLGTKKECFAVYDRTPDGTPKTIMAGYTDSGFHAEIDVVQKQPSGNYEVVYQPSGLAMDSMGCSAKLVDVDGDGISEVWFRFGGQRGEGNWIFKWDGTQLINLSPTGQNSRIGTWTQISNGMLLDIYHDGAQQILSTDASPSTPDLPERLYKLSNGQYVLDSTLLMAFPFARGSGKPAAELWPFNVGSQSTGPYILKITNGDRGGANRVSSAHILVNGQQILGPSDFNQQVEFLSAPLTNLHPGNNTLSVELDSDPGSRLIVLIQDQTPGLQSGH